jgi:hypothetical protein
LSSGSRKKEKKKKKKPKMIIIIKLQEPQARISARMRRHHRFRSGEGALETDGRETESSG